MKRAQWNFEAILNKVINAENFKDFDLEEQLNIKDMIIEQGLLRKKRKINTVSHPILKKHRIIDVDKNKSQLAELLCFLDVDSIAETKRDIHHYLNSNKLYGSNDKQIYQRIVQSQFFSSEIHRTLVKIQKNKTEAVYKSFHTQQKPKKDEVPLKKLFELEYLYNEKNGI